MKIIDFNVPRGTIEVQKLRNQCQMKGKKKKVKS